MAVTYTAGRLVAVRRIATSTLLLVAWGTGTGLVTGLALVHLLAWLGLHVDTGTSYLLHRTLLP